MARRRALSQSDLAGLARQAIDRIRAAADPAAEAERVLAEAAGPRVRAAILALASGAADRVLGPVVSAALHGSDPELSRSAAELLVGIGDPAMALKILEDCFRSSDPAVRGRAVEAIEALSAPEAVGFLPAALTDESDLVRRAATSTLSLIIGTSRHPLRAALLERLTRPDSPLNRAVVGNDDNQVRRQAAQSLAYVKSDAVVPVLAQMAGDEDDEVRQEVVLCLAAIGSGPTIELTGRMIDDPSYRVASSALDMLAGPSEIAVLADDTAFAENVAADMLSQAEHGTGHEKTLLATTSSNLATAVQLELVKQAESIAHRAGVAVLMDVVYNHIGPEGNYLGKFGHYFTDRYHTPWGDAINFDDADCGPVRQLVVDNAVMWIRDFHIDGLRLDAVDAIFDFSAHHILAELQAAVQAEAARGGRTVHVIAESDLNDMRLIDPVERGGYALDGCWADDFHHAVHTLLTGEREGYYSDFGEPAHLAKAYNDVFIYDGVYSRFRRRRHGNAVGDADRSQFVVCIHNHDQIGNRAQGDRMAATLPPEARRLAAGLLLLSPCLPLLFMGEEYGEERPFPFFCSFGDPGLIEAVRKGRRAEFAALAFEWGTEIPDPQDPATFESARLSWSWPEGSSRASLRRLYQDLLTARRTWPPLGERQRTEASVVPVEGGASAVLVIRRGGEGGLLAVANLTAEIQPLPAIDLGPRALLLSSESKWYGGSREGERRIGRLHPYELVLFGEDGWRS